VITVKLDSTIQASLFLKIISFLTLVILQYYATYAWRFIGCMLLLMSGRVHNIFFEYIADSLRKTSTKEIIVHVIN